MGCDRQCAGAVDHHPLRQWWTRSAPASCHMPTGEQKRKERKKGKKRRKKKKKKKKGEKKKKKRRKKEEKKKKKKVYAFQRS